MRGKRGRRGPEHRTPVSNGNTGGVDRTRTESAEGQDFGLSINRICGNVVDRPNRVRLVRRAGRVQGDQDLIDPIRGCVVRGRAVELVARDDRVRAEGSPSNLGESAWDVVSPGHGIRLNGRDHQIRQAGRRGGERR